MSAVRSEGEEYCLSQMNLRERIISLVPPAVAKRIHETPFGKRLAKGAFWTLIGSVAAKVLNLPISVYLVRLMGAGHYGELGMVSNSIELFGVFAGFGLAMTATKHIAEFRVKDPVRAGRILALSNVTAVMTGGFFSIVLFVAAPWLAAKYLAAPQLTGLLRIGAFLLFFTAVTSEQNGALYGFEAFRVSAQLQTIFGLVSIPLVVGGYFLGGLKGIVGGMLVAKIIDWLLRLLALHREAKRAAVPIVYHDCIHELPILWRFSVPAVAAGLMVAPVNWICSAMLVNQPHGYVEMGAYNAASQWYTALVFLPAILGTGLLPLLSASMGEGDAQSTRKVLSFMLRLNAVIVFPCVIVMALLSRYIMGAYGHGFTSAWPTLIAVVMTAGVYAVIAPIGDVIAASGRMWLGFLMNVGWGLVFVVATWLLVGRGSLGLASARLLAYSVHAIWTFAFAYTIIRQKSSASAAVETLIEP